MRVVFARREVTTARETRRPARRDVRRERGYARNGSDESTEAQEGRDTARMKIDGEARLATRGGMVERERWSKWKRHGTVQPAAKPSEGGTERASRCGRTRGGSKRVPKLTAERGARDGGRDDTAPCRAALRKYNATPLLWSRYSPRRHQRT